MRCATCCRSAATTEPSGLIVFTSLSRRRIIMLVVLSGLLLITLDKRGAGVLDRVRGVFATVLSPFDTAARAVVLPVERAWYFTKSARHSYADVEYRFDDILVFGSETSGLPPWILEKHAARTLRIPTRPQVRSLNLSNSVAVAAYEADRQWRRAGWLDEDEPKA